MKKMICVLLSLCFFAALMQGCAKQEANETTGAVETQVTTEAAEATTEAAETTEATEASEETQAPAEPEQKLHFRFDEVTLDNTQDPTCKIYNGTVKTSEVTFGSEDESVATFKNGIAVRVADGTTTVFAEFNGERLECVVTCVSE